MLKINNNINFEDLYDNKSVLMLFGALLNYPSTLLKHDKYNLIVADFLPRHHKIIFSAINNLVNSGVNDLDSIAIDSHLAKYPEQYELFVANKGLKGLAYAKKQAEGDNFEYYYNRVKKFSLLRSFVKAGIDITFIYDPDEMDSTKKEKMQEHLDSISLNELINLVELKLMEIKQEYEVSSDSHGQRAGENAQQLVKDLMEKPAIGMPLNGTLINSIVRGARLKKLYMRSAPTGVGRQMPSKRVIA